MFLSLFLAAAATAQPPLRLATYAYPRYDRAQALEPLRDLLRRRLSREVRVDLYPSPDGLRDAVRAGRVDVAMTNLSAWLGMADHPPVQAIALLDVPPATLASYRGVLLARREIAAARLAAQASALRYAEVLPGSTSGALVQAGYLRTLGLAPASFKETRQAGTHDLALSALLSGEVDVAALAEEPWRKLNAEQPDRAATLVELWRSDPLPPGPIICVQARATPCGRIARLLRSPEGVHSATELAKGWSETAGATRFRAVRASDYSAFRR